MKFVNIFIIGICMIVLSQSLYCQSYVEIIDCPTANVVVYSGYDMSFRSYLVQSEDIGYSGGFLSRFLYGVSDSVNLGISCDLGNIIHESEDLKFEFRTPRIFLKIQVLIGVVNLAAGYDSQGYGLYIDGEYEDREKGYYFVLSKEKEDLGIHVGLNVADFEDFNLRGFVGFINRLDEKTIFLVEYDNVGGGDDARLNVGIRYDIIEDRAGVMIGCKEMGSRYNWFFKLNIRKSI